MCGLAGFFSWKSELTYDSAQIIQSMTQRLSHRGPDDSGAYVDCGGHLALGHRRLSVIDTSSQGRQPMESADGRYVIVFNGEIYNFEAMKVQVETRRRSTVWRGHSDTEVLIEAIAEFGLQTAVEMCNGMFAIAVWDVARKRLSFARDRSGVKPLVISFSHGTFIFASETSALASHPSFDVTLNRGVLGAFLAFGYFPNPETIYRDALHLAPGSILEVDCSKSALDWQGLRAAACNGRGSAFSQAGRGWAYRTYWSAAAVWQAGRANPFDGSFTDAVNECETLLRDSLSLRLVSDVPLGVFLSGGIDSSLVALIAQQQSSRKLNTYTIGFTDRQFDESSHAAEVAKRIGSDHHTFILTERDCLDVACKLHELQDEPLGDYSFIPTYLLSEQARQAVTVALTGDGADETFWGYWRYRAYQRVGWVYRLPLWVRRGASLLSEQFGDEPVARGGLRWPFYRVSKLLQLCGGSSFLGAYYHSQMAHGYDRLVRHAIDPLDKKADACILPSRDTGCLMTFADTSGYLPDDLHIKVDRASMRVALECREPLLDYRLTEFAARLPQWMKVSSRKGKVVLRGVLARFLPEDMFNRPKQGFSIPMERWLRTSLKAWAEQVMDSASRHNLIDTRELRRIWDRHQSGQANHKNILWNTLALLEWLNTHDWA